MKTAAISLCLAGLLAACGSENSPPPATSGAVDVHAHILNADIHPAEVEPVLPPEKLINVNMFQMMVPAGTITHNDAFWKLVQEDVVDVAAADLLSKNGFRVGRGNVSDWGKFRDIMDRDTTVFVPTNFVGPAGKETQINVTRVVPEETLWVFDEHGPAGRSFDDCRNSFSFHFEWAPRKKNTIRVRICPVVTATRQRMDYSTNDDPEPTTITAPEHLYDLRLFADIAPGEFLVIGPSQDAAEPGRVGHVFLTVEGAAALYEKVIVLVGEPVQFGSAAAATQPAK